MSFPCICHMVWHMHGAMYCVASIRFTYSSVACRWMRIVLSRCDVIILKNLVWRSCNKVVAVGTPAIRHTYVKKPLTWLLFVPAEGLDLMTALNAFHTRQLLLHRRMALGVILTWPIVSTLVTIVSVTGIPSGLRCWNSSGYTQSSYCIVLHKPITNILLSTKTWPTELT